MSGRPVILITGAGGFTGRYACRHFAWKGWKVKAVFHSPAGTVRDSDKAGDEEWLVCNLTDRTQVGKLVEEAEPDYVLHLAGRNAVDDSWKDPVGSMEANLLGTLYLLDELRRKNGEIRTLVAGSMLSFPLGESPRPPHPYSLSKALQVLAAQCWHHLFSQQVMVVQPANLIGPGRCGICGLLAERFVRLERGKVDPPFRFSSLGQKREFLDVRDAVRAYETILIHGESGRVYSIGSGHFHSLRDILNIYETLCGRELSFEAESAEPGNDPTAADLGLIHQLGWNEIIPLEKSLADALDFYRNYNHSIL